MALGILIPLVLLFIALIEFLIFRSWQAKGMISERASMIMRAASFALPVVAYLLFATLFPDTGSLKVF